MMAMRELQYRFRRQQMNIRRSWRYKGWIRSSNNGTTYSPSVQSEMSFIRNLAEIRNFLSISTFEIVLYPGCCVVTTQIGPVLQPNEFKRSIFLTIKHELFW